MKKIENPLKLLTISVLWVAVMASFACTDERILKSNKNAVQTNASESMRSNFETDLETMKTANFEFIFVIRRKDRSEFDSEDRKYLINNKPAQINRFILTDEGRAFIAGSKYRFPEENLNNIKARFNVEDLSAVKATEPENTNQAPQKENSNAAK